MAENMIHLDENCARLLDEVQQYCHVYFEEYNNNHCAFQTTNRDASGFATEGVLYYHKGYLQASICHELLHAKCDCYFGDNRSLLFNDSDDFIKRHIMDFSLWQSFENQVQHKIIGSDYIQLGYKAEDFFENADFSKASSRQVKQFAANGILIKGKQEYDPISLKTYINVLIHLLFYPFGTPFQSQLRRMEMIDKQLFRIHKDLQISIKDIKVDAQFRDAYIQATHQYRDQMSVWFEKNPIKFPNPGEISMLLHMITD